MTHAAAMPKLTEIEHELLVKIEEFLNHHDMPATTFGMLSCGSAHVVGRLRDGLGMNLKRYGRIRAFMREYPAERVREVA
jgi:hypothetical protein